MGAATAASTTTRLAVRRAALGRVAGCTPATAGTTELTLCDAEGAHRSLVVAGRPDDAAGRRVAASFRRVSWARLEVGEAGARATVSGVRHRLPATVGVPVDAVLGLAERGVPTLVVRG